MAIIGADYYPKRSEIFEIVNNILKNVKFDDAIKLNSNDEPFKLFRNYKTGIVGINNFIVHSNLSEQVKNRLEQIRNGELDRRYMFYNPVDIYHLANEINYQLSVPRGEYISRQNFLILKGVMDDLVHRGANLEEVKKNILLDNLIAFNNKEDSYIGTSYNEYLMENAIETIETIERFDDESPYYKVLKLYREASLEHDPNLFNQKSKIANAEIAKCDPVMLKAFAFDKVACDILSCLVRLRYVTKSDKFLDTVSIVEKVEDKYTHSEPILRRNYYESFIENIFNFVTMRGNIKYSEILQLFNNLLDSVGKNFRDVNIKEVKEEFMSALLLFSSLSQASASGSSSTNDYNDYERED